MLVNVDEQYMSELHEILCKIPFEKPSVTDYEPSFKRHPAIESIIEQLEERIEYLEIHE